MTPAWRAVSLLPALTLFLSFAARGATSTACAGFFPGGTPPAFTDLRLSQGVALLCNDAFAVAASPVSRGGLWSAERLTASGVEEAHGLSRDGEFHPDPRLSPGSRAELDDYRESGFDRGHLAPSGDMPTPEAQQQSFSLANMVPQQAVLNRGRWADIEAGVRRLATERGELFVVTGPAFTGRTIQAIGADGVLVPTATWKAVYDPASASSGAYACSNTARPTCRVLPVAVLAATVGVDPFPAVPAAAKARLMALPPIVASRPPRRSGAAGRFAFP